MQLRSDSYNELRKGALHVSASVFLAYVPLAVNCETPISSPMQETYGKTWKDDQEDQGVEIEQRWRTRNCKTRI